MWLCGQMSPVEHRLGDKWSIICLSNINCEWWKRWKPSTYCVEKAVSHRAFLQAMLLVQSWEVSASPLLRSQSLTVSSLVFTQDRKNGSRNVCCVYSGRAAPGHHAYCSTQLKLWDSVVLSWHHCNMTEAQINISFAFLMLTKYLSCVPGTSGVSCGKLTPCYTYTQLPVY